MSASVEGRADVENSRLDVCFGPRLRENVRARKARRMVFSIVLSRQPSPALLFFKLIEVETKFPFTNSISEFSRSQDPVPIVNLIQLASRGESADATE